MGLTKIFIPNPYACSWCSSANKICEWIVIIICMCLLLYFNGIDGYKQCIPGRDVDCGDSEITSPDPELGYPVRESTVSFVAMNIICPIIWIFIFIINILIIHYYHSLSLNKVYKIILIKFEILLRSVAISIAFTSLTTDIIKTSVGRPRPNYLQNDDKNDAMKSFPSGHTSYIFSIFFILTLYLLHSLLNSRKIIYFYQLNKVINKKIKISKAIKKNKNKNKNIDDNDDKAALSPLSSKSEDFINFPYDDDNDDNNDENKVNLLMDGDIINGIQINGIINVFNGDSYFFLSLFLFLRHCQIISLLIAIGPTLFAVYVGCSRLTDYKHHYSDVVGGALIGIFYAFLSFTYYKTEFYYGFQYDINKIFAFQNNNNNQNQDDLNDTQIQIQIQDR